MPLKFFLQFFLHIYSDAAFNYRTQTIPYKSVLFQALFVTLNKCVTSIQLSIKDFSRWFDHDR